MIHIGITSNRNPATSTDSTLKLILCSVTNVGLTTPTNDTENEIRANLYNRKRYPGLNSIISRSTSLILIVSKIEEIVAPLRRRSTNRVVVDSITLVNWINESNIANRVSGGHYVVEPRDSVIEKDTGLTKKQIQNAKSLLKKVGVIKFWKKTRGSNGSWRMFWNFSVYYSRLVQVIKRSSESREFLFPYINKHGYMSWTKTFSFDTKRHFVRPKYRGILYRETRDILAGRVYLSKNSKDEKPENWIDSAMKISPEFEISF